MPLPKDYMNQEVETRPMRDNDKDESSSILSTESYDATTTFHESYTGESIHNRKRRMNNNNSNDSTEEIKTSEKSTKEIRQVRLIVVLVLLISTAGAVAVFLYTKDSEQDQFEFQFQDDSNKVLGSLLNSIERSLGAFNQLSTSFLLMIQLQNQTFPFIRIPDYAAQVARSLEYTGAVCTYFTPVVKGNIRREWENYTSGNNTLIWSIMNETLNFQRTFQDYTGPMPEDYNWTFRDTIYTDYGDTPYNETHEIFIPEIHTFPLIMKNYAAANFDWVSVMEPSVLDDMLSKKQASISAPWLIEDPNDPIALFFRDFLPPEESTTEPFSFWAYPVVDKIDYIDITTNPKYPEDYEVKAFVIANVFWRHLLRDILPPNSKGIVVVVEHQLYHDQFTYQIDGSSAIFMGGGDHHDPKYDSMKITRNLFDLDMYRMGKSHYYGLPVYLSNNFTYTVSVYPSDEMKSTFTTSKPIIFAVSAVAFILFPFLLFIVYDRTVTRQQQEILTTANRSHAIVSSLFPSSIRDQLFPQDFKGMTAGGSTSKLHPNTLNTTHALGPPIAELHPETTVLFCDIVDFTKWSSVRDPSQVFTLLESLYCAFDVIANRRNIFKVETIGDCYVAVAGLPEPRRDHAEVMARFGHEMLRKVTEVTAELGTTLGPGTASLQVRIGINSGPTTAGVLRGAKGRFQLFGDTVNTAARMESNSLPGKIMCSQKTADILIASGKEKWVQVREGLVDAKGKGMVQCYWIDLRRSSGSGGNGGHATGSVSHSISTEDPLIDSIGDLEAQSVAWITEVFESLLYDLVIQRKPLANKERFSLEQFTATLTNPRDEVSEIIVLPKGTYRKSPTNSDSQRFQTINITVRQQIHAYVSAIAKLYRSNPFHNFHHATHVVMSSRKLLNRVAKPTESSVSATAYGISSDPLSQFAIVFSALIHDVDHPGVSNAQLVKENADVAIQFNNKSVAEQNSVSLAWNLLLEPQYTEFRNLIMVTEDESRRFRQLIINSVMATDLFDADLKKLRETRWARVFDTNTQPDLIDTFEIDEIDSNRRATIVIEHLIQASDVCHTMQHWHVYQEWNRRLLHEMYQAYKDGRSEKDPFIGWYDGELWFFDNYIIPLAKKLETCGVFGVSVGELLDYARDNRAEWAAKGRTIVEESRIAICSKLLFEN